MDNMINTEDLHFRINDLIKKLKEIENDGYDYITMSFYRMKEDGEVKEWMNIIADDDGGYSGVDYDYIDAVPYSEIEEKAYIRKTKR